MYADAVRQWREHPNGRLMRALMRAESIYGRMLGRALVVVVALATLALVAVAFYTLLTKRLH